MTIEQANYIADESNRDASAARNKANIALAAIPRHTNSHFPGSPCTAACAAYAPTAEYYRLHFAARMLEASAFNATKQAALVECGIL